MLEAKLPELPPDSTGGRRESPAGAAGTGVEAHAGAGAVRGVGRFLVLAATDLLALILSSLAAHLATPDAARSLAGSARWTPLVLVFVVGYQLAGLYPGLGMTAAERLRRFSHTTALCFVLLAALGVGREPPRAPFGTALAVALLVSLGLVPSLRSLLLRLARRWEWWTLPVALAGDRERVRDVLTGLSADPSAGHRVVAAFLTDAAPLPASIGRVPVAGAGELLAEGGRVQGVEALVVCGAVPQGMSLDRLAGRFGRVVLVPSGRGGAGHRASVGALAAVGGLVRGSGLQRRSQLVAKRGLDLLLGGLGLVLAAPVIGLAAVAVKAKTRGPAFFAQRRVGLNGTAFSMIKIRTMAVGSESDLPAHLDGDAGLREQWETRFKLRSDPRLIPGLGAFLRSYSLDELPQLWNVIRGDMSLVGPRPFPDYHVARFTPEFRRLRQRVKPGITGLWQVTVRSGGDLEYQELYDGYYVRNWSIWLDLQILAGTLEPVLSGRDAH